MWEGFLILMILIDVTPNHIAYFPILIDQKEYGKSRDEVYEHLKSKGIYSRRYFYPLISHFPTYRGLPTAKPSNLPIAERIASQILCLPMYAALRRIGSKKSIICFKIQMVIFFNKQTSNVIWSQIKILC